MKISNSNLIETLFIGTGVCRMFLKPKNDVVIYDAAVIKEHSLKFVQAFGKL